MVGRSAIEEYAKGYTDNLNMKIVAFRFSKLGERALGLPACDYNLYLDTHSFIYDSINDGLRFQPAVKVDFNLGMEDIPIEYTDECDEYIPELVCEISMLGSGMEVLSYDCEYFPFPLNLRLPRYLSFARESCERSVKTAQMALNVEDYILDNYAHYAFLMGAGMPVKEAISERRRKIQMGYSNLQ